MPLFALKYYHHHHYYVGSDDHYYYYDNCADQHHNQYDDNCADQHNHNCHNNTNEHNHNCHNYTDQHNNNNCGGNRRAGTTHERGPVQHRGTDLGSATIGRAGDDLLRIRGQWTNRQVRQ